MWRDNGAVKTAARWRAAGRHARSAASRGGWLMASQFSKGAANNRRSNRYSVEGVARAVQLLQLFSRTSSNHSTEEMARLSGASPSFVKRAMHTLQRHGLVRDPAKDHDGQERHRLGLRWLQLADVRRRQVDIRLVALPWMRLIRDAVNETVILSVRVGHRRVNIDYVESTQPIRRLTQLGFEVPLHIGATGRVLMSGLSPVELDRYLQTNSLDSLSTKTTLSKARLGDDVENVHREGYAVAFREITSDTAAVSAPVRDHMGGVVAAITISCPEDRFTAKLKQACIREVTRSAQAISQALGYKASLPG